MDIAPPTFCCSSEQLLPQVFDGCKMVVQKGLSRHLQTSHTLTLSAGSQPSQWQFGGVYVGNKQVAENDVRHTCCIILNPKLVGVVSTLCQ